jgi:hypothetical protein
MSDDRSIKAPRVMNITSQYTFPKFDSLFLVDNGGSGFQLTDNYGNTVTIPTATPISLGGQAGMASGPITIKAPLSGSLNVSAVYYL